MKTIFAFLALQGMALATTFHVTDSTDFLNKYFYQGASGDTFVFHTPVYTSAQMTGKTFTFVGIDTVPRIKWHGTLKCTNSKVYMRNIDFQGEAGSSGGGYCAYGSCGSCNPGGSGQTTLTLTNTQAAIEKCSFIGGRPGLGGLPTIKFSVDGPCDSCGLRCPDGKPGYGIELASKSTADTLKVGYDSLLSHRLKVDSTSSLKPFQPNTLIRKPHRKGSGIPAPTEPDYYSIKGQKAKPGPNRPRRQPMVVKSK